MLGKSIRMCCLDADGLSRNVNECMLFWVLSKSSIGGPRAHGGLRTPRRSLPSSTSVWQSIISVWQSRLFLGEQNTVLSYLLFVGNCGNCHR